MKRDIPFNMILLILSGISMFRLLAHRIPYSVTLQVLVLLLWVQQHQEPLLPERVIPEHRLIDSITFVTLFPETLVQMLDHLLMVISSNRVALVSVQLILKFRLIIMMVHLQMNRSKETLALSLIQYGMVLIPLLLIQNSLTT